MASLLRDDITRVSRGPSGCASLRPSGPARTGATPPAGLAGPFAALVIGACAMGASPIFVRLAAPEIGPFASAFWRVALALPLLYGWMRLEAAPSGGRPDGAILLAGAAFAGDLVFWHLAILATTVANATFFATTAPVFVVLITWLVFRRAVAGRTLGGLALCLAGGAALIGQSLEVAPGRIAGDLYGIVTAMFFALYFLSVSRARTGSGAGRVTFLSSLGTAAILLVVALAFDAARFWPQSPAVWAALGGLAVVSHAGGQGLLAVALGRLPAVFSSLVIFLEAVFAAAAGWVVLGEALSAVQYAGGALILAGIWLSRPRKPGWSA